MNRKGFTLIELLIVIAIMGLLAAIAIPGYIGQQRRAARTEAYTNLESLRLLQEQYFAENGQYAPTTGVAGPDQPGNIALIQAANILPGFRPGTNLNFSYRIVKDVNLGGGTQTPCFTAIATGNTTSRVAGDIFMIDCNNNKNF